MKSSTLLILAASAAVVSLGLPAQRSGAPVQGFLIGRQHPPTAAGQSATTTSKCNQERDDLQKALDTLLAKKGQLGACQGEIKQRQLLIEAVKKNVARVVPMLAARVDESDLAPKYLSEYNSLMCMQIYDAFVHKDSKARIAIMATCSSQKPVQQQAVTGFGSLLKAEQAMQQSRVLAPTSHATSFLKFFHAAEVASMTPECFQAKALQDEFDKAKVARSSLTWACDAKETEQTTELAALKTKEDKLWTAYHGHMSNEPQIKAQAEAQVKSKFCSVIQQHYNKDESVIVAVSNQNCMR